MRWVWYSQVVLLVWSNSYLPHQDLATVLDEIEKAVKEQESTLKIES